MADLERDSALDTSLPSAGLAGGVASLAANRDVALTALQGVATAPAAGREVATPSEVATAREVATPVSLARGESVLKCRYSSERAQ